MLKSHDSSLVEFRTNDCGEIVLFPPAQGGNKLEILKSLGLEVNAASKRVGDACWKASCVGDLAESLVDFAVAIHNQSDYVQAFGNVCGIDQADALDMIDKHVCHVVREAADSRRRARLAV
jgi:hypothetical protein